MSKGIEPQSSYVCVEELITQDGTIYEEGDRIGEDVLIYLQPNEREHFQEI